MKSKVVDKSIVKEVIKDGMHVLASGFLGGGTPKVIVDEIINNNIKDLTVYTIDASFPDNGIGPLVASGNIKTLVVSHIGKDPVAQDKMKDGSMEVKLLPMGTLVEAIRAGGCGLGGILTPTGVGTEVAKGRQIINIKGKDYILEEAIKGDVAIVQAYQADHFGNCVLRGTRINSNEVMALSGEKVIVAAEEIVDHLDPNLIKIPGVLVDYVIQEEM
ncbi:MAG: 3-oxoacid CoA-transferase subunit A [Bacilli bacterium]|jgi:acetate CoA/acetoacetate CoA-transferase alpha subunit|nr:3-oxoacid CoA-transferase subunit A [Bacilli bacterium]